jgi:hypothetical protein
MTGSTTTGTGIRRRPATAVRIAGAVLLAATGVIHLYLVATGVGGLLGVLFVLNGIAGVVLAIGLLALRGRLLGFAAVLGLLFLVASLAALLLALTVGLFGIRETWDFTLVPETVVVEAIGIVVMAVASAMTARAPRSA